MSVSKKKYRLLCLTSLVPCRTEEGMASSVRFTAELFLRGCSYMSKYPIIFPDPKIYYVTKSVERRLSIPLKKVSA